MDFFSLIDTETIVLTPNRRLASILHAHYQEAQLAAGHISWPTPDILPAASWIQRLWQDYASTQNDDILTLLNLQQEIFIWEKILRDAKQSQILLQLSETAEMAKSAWGLLKQWQIDLHHPIFSTTEDYLALQEWMLTFAKWCEENHYIDAVTLTDLVHHYFKQSLIKINKTLLLVGFTEITPQFSDLLASIEKTGVSIQTLPYFSKTPALSSYRISVADAEEEIQRMGEWACALLKKQPTAKIACVIPNLDKMRDRVLQVFSSIFAPQSTYTIDRQTAPFNLSAGKPLSHFPIIHTALQLLALYKNKLSLEDFSYLLSSPFWGDAETEKFNRALLDKTLRQENIIQIDLREYDDDLLATCPLLVNRLKHFFGSIDATIISLSFHEWANLFTLLLTELGWPGERSLNSEEYQVVESWLDLLNQFSTLDYIQTSVSWSLALTTLEKLARKTIFQPKTPTAPVQVLGLLEAAGSPFDYMWVAGMDDISWPPQPKPHPFIPKRLQREKKMPHATAERELTFCHSLIQQFTHSTKHIIFSYAEIREAVELQPSALIKDITPITFSSLNIAPYSTPAERIYAAKALEYLIDEKAPTLTQEVKLRGGVNVIKYQALCPFKSFAEWRLHAKELEQPQPGLRAKDRGSIIHKVLEIFWNDIKDHATLVSLTETALHNKIASCIQTALKLYRHSRNNHQHYLSLEKKRLQQIIMGWLTLEKERPPFKVLANEKTIKVNFESMTFSIRIDRIDELSDGKKLIIDYKTSKSSDINQWLSDRPDEPQLPLYALFDEAIGITFAQVAPGEHCFKGMSCYGLDIKGVRSISEIKKITTSSWNEQLTQWKETLATLSADFYSGNAKIDPKHPEQTCQYCRLQSLCRINEEMICQPN